MQDIILYTIILIATVIIIIIFSLIIASIKIVKEYERAIIFRLGRFLGVKGPGLFWIIPGMGHTKAVRLISGHCAVRLSTATRPVYLNRIVAFFEEMLKPGAR